jgi:hypothetical protein
MRVIREIQRGGFGRVDEVVHNRRRYARKTFEPSIPTTPAELDKLKKRFDREVRVQAAIESHALMPIERYDLDDDPPWFLMPLADRSLAEEVQAYKNGGALPDAALADVLNGLEELHALGFVHRDLKPQNVLLHNGTWKLSDFGLVLPTTGATTQLTTRSAWGTQAYASPEQAVTFHSVNALADIYSFGCILHDFFGTDIRVPYKRYSAPGALGPIIERCTEEDPTKRFQSIQQLREVLLTELAAPAQATGSLQAQSWDAVLKAPQEWTLEAFMSFLTFLRSEQTARAAYGLISQIDEENLAAMHALDASRWEQVASMICDWARSSSFAFSFCDVIVGRLMTIYNLGSINVKAESAIAAVCLAASHHRFYVMAHALDMCGAHMEAGVAQRVAIEIRIGRLQREFRTCATAISRELSEVHPKIYEVLTDNT